MATRVTLTFGDLLRRTRLAAGLTQERLAERASLSVRAISDLERGVKRAPQHYTVQRLAEALEMSDDDRAALEGTIGRRRGPAPCSPSPVQTFLVTDIRGYTAFTHARGDEAAARLTSRFAELVGQVVARWGGEVIEVRGDEVLARFASARGALRASLDVQQELGQRTEQDASLPLCAGVGLDAGEAVPVEGGYRGGALNLAARLCSLAGPGEVFASEGVIHLARAMEDLVDLDRGEVKLKGLPEPARLIQVTRVGEVPTDVPRFGVRSNAISLPLQPTPYYWQAARDRGGRSAAAARRGAPPDPDRTWRHREDAAGPAGRRRGGRRLSGRHCLRVAGLTCQPGACSCHHCRRPRDYAVRRTTNPGKTGRASPGETAAPAAG